MIDEKKLIEVLKKHFDADYGEDGRLLYSDHVCTSDDVEDIIKLVEEQPRVGEWISCSERLPEEGTVVLVSLEEDEDWSWVRLVREGYYDEGYWFDMDGAHYGVEVLAWMPLPPVYKEGE